MATGAADPVFLDTNVLVYATVPTTPEHPAAIRALRDLEHAGTELVFSRQIIREFLATLTRPQTFTKPLSIVDLSIQVGIYSGQFRLIEDGPAVTRQLLSLLSAIPTGGRQIHDANIVATMLAHDIPNLLTHNVSDFARFAGRITVLSL